MPKVSKRPVLTREEVERHLGLDRAAAARREAAERQDRASWLCIDCHGPDGEHAGSCEVQDA